MAQYIDKDAVVAEIESKIEKYTKRGEESDAKRDGYGMYWGGVLSCLNEVKTLIDTLEVKEVNLEKEDERIRKEIIAILKYKYEHYPKASKYRNAPQWVAWLEKQGEQKSSEWSDDDEKRMNHIIQFLEDKDRWKDSERAFPIEEDIRWLKSLRHQTSTSKPLTQ